MAAVYPDVFIGNTMTIVDARAKLSANRLKQANVDFTDGVVTFTFTHDVEDVIDKNDVQNGFALVKLSGETTTFGDLGVAPDDIAIDGKTVTVKLDADDVDHSQALIELAGVAIVEAFDAAEEKKRIVPGFAAVQRTLSLGESYAPTLKGIESEYDAEDELLTVHFHFSMNIAATSNAERQFKLYDTNGEEIGVDVTIVDVEDNVITVVFEIDSEDFEQVVAIAVERGAVMANDDFKVGTETPERLWNPAFHIALE